MLLSFPVLILGPPTIQVAPSVPQSQQSRSQAHLSQVTVHLTVAREPRPKVPDEKATATPVAPMLPLVSRRFTGRVVLSNSGSALITVNDEKRVERQRLTINPQTAVIWQAATKPGLPSLYKELPFAGAFGALS